MQRVKKLQIFGMNYIHCVAEKKKRKRCVSEWWTDNHRDSTVYIE